MTTYKEIFGKPVKVLSSDPTDAGAEGQVWYNSTSGTFKTVLAVGAWSSGANTISNVFAAGGAGTQTAGLGFGGNAGPANTNATYEYNGTGWSNVPATLGTAKSYVSSAAAGTQTATLVAGGSTGTPTGQTEEYNGTSWSEQNDMANARDSGLAFGTQTAFINSGGVPGYPWGSPASTSTESYDGTNWTAASSVNNARAQGGGFGISTAGLIFGGRTSSPATSPSALLATTESYNGSSWTSENILNTGRLYLSSGSGTLTSGVTAGGIAYPGGTPTVTTTTETYDGTSWTTSPSSLATTRYVGAGGFGSGTSAVVFGGRNGPVVYNLTEEYNFTANTITPGAWASGGTIPYSAGSKNGSGILTAAFVVGGETPPGAMVNTSASYNGTSWTATNNINSARGNVQAAGTLTAGLIMGGYQNVPDPNFLFDETEEFNGTSWSEVNNMPTGGYSGSGTGTQTAAFVNNMYIGSPGERTNVTYEYDGTNWSSGGNTAETTNSRSSVGTLTAGLTVGGRPAPSSYIDKTELYNGTSWTSGVDMISEFQNGGQSSKGTQSDCIIFGSPRSPVNTDAFKTDGTTWFTSPSLVSAQNEGTGTSTAALAFGNNNPIQEFTGETTAANIKTLTSS